MARQRGFARRINISRTTLVTQHSNDLIPYATKRTAGHHHRVS